MIETVKKFVYIYKLAKVNSQKLLAQIKHQSAQITAEMEEKGEYSILSMRGCGNVPSLQIYDEL